MSTFSSRQVIHLRDSGQEVTPGNVYFTFSSGALAYDCIRCNARCCRGHGYLVQARHELQAQLRVSQDLVLFLDLAPDRDASGSVKVRNCPPGCFFLSEQGRCGIQSSLGYDSKPETCRLFPFNNFRRVGDHLIVEPHFDLCPLRVSGARGKHAESEHHILLSDMIARGIGAPIHRCGPLFDTLPTALNLESDILGTSERYRESGDYHGFLEAQIQSTSRISRSPESLVRDSPHSSIEQMAKQICWLVDLPQFEMYDEALGRVLVTMSATLRSQMVFVKENPNAEHCLDPWLIPFAQLAIHLLGSCALRAGMRTVSCETVVRLIRDNASLIAMLAHLDTPVSWDSDAVIELDAGLKQETQRRAYLRIAKALLPREQRLVRRRLGDVLTENVVGSGLDRVTLLRYLSSRFAGKIKLFHRPEHPRRGPAIRARLRRFLIQNASEEALLRASKSLTQEK
jgi:Fe-S-cluster containining protein